ncbi:hypothetical protein F5X97DRAFT_320988 [Nemania serpens]|nr:hypothetical protein F5X97DRAFT_320988 [Nemania serpens]
MHPMNNNPECLAVLEALITCMTMEAAECLEVELDLLFAMYPQTLSFSPQARELKYHLHCNEESNIIPPAILLLRLPDTYPLGVYPEMITPKGRYKEGLRAATKAAFCSIRPLSSIGALARKS